jgi:hypothetical protein
VHLHRRGDAHIVHVPAAAHPVRSLVHGPGVALAPYLMCHVMFSQNWHVVHALSGHAISFVKAFSVSRTFRFESPRHHPARQCPARCAKSSAYEALLLLRFIQEATPA